MIPLLAIIFGSREFDSIARKINKWVPKFGLREIKAGYRSDNQLSSDYIEHTLGQVLNLSVSSAGARQVLSIITHLFSAPDRSINIIEEPEISLHPESQLHLIELFAEVIREEKQILITTHSPIMMMALSHAVQQAKLKDSDVAIYHVQKKKGSGTTAKPLPIGSQGYIEGWIPSFAKVERKLMREWVRSLPEV